MLFEIETCGNTYYAKAVCMPDAIAQVVSICKTTEATVRAVKNIETFKELFTEFEAEEVVDRLEFMRSDSTISQAQYERYTQMENNITDGEETLYSIYDNLELAITVSEIYRKISNTLYKTI